MTAELNAKNMRKTVGVDHNFDPFDVNWRLTENERQLLLERRFESLSGKEAEPTLQLLNVSKTLDKKKVIDDLSLTIFEDEIFVLIGENGAGKTQVLKSIAGNQRGLKGVIQAYGLEFSKVDIRFTDNFFSAALTPELTINSLTVHEHFQFLCKFTGLEDADEVSINQMIADFDLQNCAKIAADRISGA